ncbi:MAG: YihY/virulence factor BrkB family protein [Myxococcota bacterium]
MTASDRGRRAQRPWQLGWRGWWDVTRRVRARLEDDHIGIIAGGVAFYAFLAVFPAIAALISVYGLFADPQQVEHQLMAVGGVMPEATRSILAQQMRRVAAASGTALSWGVVLSVALAIWSSSRGMRSLIEALNVAYGEHDDRNVVVRYGLTLLLTLGGILTALVAIGLVVSIPVLLMHVGLGAFTATAVSLARWPILALLLLVGLAVVYRYGPDREDPQWRWVSPGAVAALILWLAGSALLSVYVENFGSYNETYGTLGAVAVLLLWFFVSAFVVLLGAEVNAEAERQTEEDTTTGDPRAIGTRGAHAADTLGEAPPTKG